MRYQPQGLPWEPSMDWHALLLLSAAGGTQALRTDEELDELPPAASGLRLDRRTLLAGNLLSASRIVQARPSLKQCASISSDLIATGCWPATCCPPRASSRHAHLF